VSINNIDVVNTADPDYDAIAILYSSGTTSIAKGVVIGYEQELIALDCLLRVVRTSKIRYLMIFPNSHVSGYTDFLVIIMRGGELATIEGANALSIMEGFREYKPNTFGMVPRVWETFKEKIEEGINEQGADKARKIFGLIEKCGALREKTGINLGRILFKKINKSVFGGALKQVHIGGGKSNPEVTRFFWNLGYDVFDFYASTETNIPICVSDGRKYMSGVGEVNSIPEVSIRIKDEDENGIGEIQVKSKMIMRGYFRNEELTQQSFEEGYFKTGDYGKIENNQLFITGRIKESIPLVNGEKVSPEDIENSYKQYLNKAVEFAVAGISSNDDYEYVGVFVVGKEGEYDDEFVHVNKSVSTNFRYKQIIYLQELPKTSVGKIKRFELKKIAENIHHENYELKSVQDGMMDIDNSVKILLKKICNQSVIDESSMLKDDLNIDSLMMFELCTEIDKIWNIQIENHLEGVDSVSDLISTIQQVVQKEMVYTTQLDYDMFPAPKTKENVELLIESLNKIRQTYNVFVKGLENVPQETNCIFCSNHVCNLDPLFILAALGDKYVESEKFATLAAMHTLKDNPDMFNMVGGIPVDREGNTIPAMARCNWSLSNGYSMIIFPEGARTRDGSLLPFKRGASELAKVNNVPIIPIRINGAYDIFPRHIERPRTINENTGEKYSLEILFGNPIFANEITENECTEKIRQRIIELGE